jgi:hypothetical protein
MCTTGLARDGSEHRSGFAHRPASVDERLTRALGFASYRLKRDDNTVDWTYGDLPALAAAAEQAGMRHLVIEGWRKQEGPGNPAPFCELADPRLGGAPALKQIIGVLQRKGTELLFAFHPALLNAPRERYPSEFASWTVKTRLATSRRLALPQRRLSGRLQVRASPSKSIGIRCQRLPHRDAQRLRRIWLAICCSRASANGRSLVHRRGSIASERLRDRLRTCWESCGTSTPTACNNEGVNDLVNPFGDGAYTEPSTDPRAGLQPAVERVLD